MSQPEPSPALTPPAARQFDCQQCGAKLTYQPGTRSLACGYCGHENAIPETSQSVAEIDYRATLLELAGSGETEAHTTVKCSTCGAEIDKPPTLEALKCPFCGAGIVDVGRSRRHIKPQALLPFNIDRRQATARFHAWLKSLWFAPTAVKRFSRIEHKLSGVYTPYWTFDSDTVSHYTGERGDHYYVTVGAGKNRRRERRTRWRSASGVVSRRFDDVLILASQSLPKQYAEALAPWDLAKLVPYADEFLAGFQAERYTVELAEGFDLARGVMDAEIRALVRQDIGGDEQRIHSLHTEHSNITFKHLMLPVWISAYRFRRKVYRFLVNARTGEVQGERPYSWIKITAALLTLVGAVAATIWYFNRT